MTAAVWSAYS